MQNFSLSKERDNTTWRDSVLKSITSKKPLIVILGPTGSGKTQFSLRVCDELVRLGHKPEVINADSRQIYRYLTVGTAKISTKEMADVPHHLIDVLDPKDPLSIAWFKEHASRCIHDIHLRGAIPILVGGSMLYISAIIDGLEPLPPGDTALRTSLEVEYDKDDGVSLLKRLHCIDSEVADSIPRQNKLYLIRAMEIASQSGGSPKNVKSKTPCPYDLLIFGMEWPRDILVQRINGRTRKMFEHGWIDEVRSLMNQGYSVDDPGMKSVGKNLGSVEKILFFNKSRVDKRNKRASQNIRINPWS